MSTTGIRFKTVLALLAPGLLLGCGSERYHHNGDGGEDGDEVDGTIDGVDLGDMEDQPDLPDGCTPEQCNGIDDDCDGEIDEGFDLMTSVDHCGACNFPCSTMNAVPGCTDGTCILLECLPGAWDVNGSPWDGCEYLCDKEADNEVDGADGTCADGLDNDCDGRTDDDDTDCNDCVPEYCNMEDDDCDTLVDEDFDLRTDVLNCGACGAICAHRPNSSPLCQNGACDILCSAGFADLDGDTTNGCEAICVPSADPSEFECNGIDDDCDGPKDEDYVPYTCGQGACQTGSVCARGAESCVPLEPLSPIDALCDGIDNDCDGSTDEEFEPVTCRGTCVAGARCEGGTEICGPPTEEPDTVCDGVDGDCDGEADEDYIPYTCGAGVCQNGSTCESGSEDCSPLPPRSTEDLTCDDLDDDCDGFVDEEYVPYACGVGECENMSNCLNGAESCTPASPLATQDLVCDGLDEDCDSSIDEDYIAYTCGIGACLRDSTCVDGTDDCTPGTPSASDRTCNNSDDDCDGFTDEDYIPYTCGSGLCVANSVCTAGSESCTPLTPPVSQDQVCDNRDEDCDARTDEDYRPYTCGLGVCLRSSTCVGGVESCTPGSPTGGETTCNGQDDDCDGVADENYVSYQCGAGACIASSTCVGGVESCTPGTSTPEVCDNIDNDCNGEIDDIFPCRAGQSQNCTTGCGTTGTQICTSACAWGPCTPPSEVCNGIDDDCDSTCDDGYPCCQGSTGSCTASCGTTGSRVCSSACSWGSCTPPTEVCNGIDDDCDGGCDDGWTCCSGSTGSCTASCGTTGSRVCNASCAWGSCTPPTEQCNGIDDDCDGTCDDGWSCCRNATGSCTTSCGTTGTHTCNSSCAWGSCTPPSETCNGIDDDCDSLCDDGWTCCRGSTSSCTASCGSTGTRTCDSSCGWGSCTPPAESCNGVDDDCDGLCDDGWTCCQGATGTCTTSCGSTGNHTCNSSCGWGTCVPPTEVCNGADDDCDGATDEGFDDAYEPSENCAAARNMGTVSDISSSDTITISGQVKSSSDNDWYVISATDDVDTTADEFDLQIYFTANPGGLAIDVYRGNCSGSGPPPYGTRICTGVSDCVRWTMDGAWYSTIDVSGAPYDGENPCRSSSTPGYNTCTSETGNWYIRVYRISGSGACSPYTIVVDNNPASNGAGCANPT